MWFEFSYFFFANILIPSVGWIYQMARNWKEINKNHRWPESIVDDIFDIKIYGNFPLLFFHPPTTKKNYQSAITWWPLVQKADHIDGWWTTSTNNHPAKKKYKNNLKLGRLTNFEPFKHDGHHQSGHDKMKIRLIIWYWDTWIKQMVNGFNWWRRIYWWWFISEYQKKKLLKNFSKNYTGNFSDQIN